jgi:hypothetical protein
MKQEKTRTQAPSGGLVISRKESSVLQPKSKMDSTNNKINGNGNGQQKIPEVSVEVPQST